MTLRDRLPELCVMLIGMAALFAWNAVITIPTYWRQRFCGSPLARYHESAFSLAYQAAALVVAAWAPKLSRRISVRRRIVPTTCCPGRHLRPLRVVGGLGRRAARLSIRSSNSNRRGPLRWFITVTMLSDARRLRGPPGQFYRSKYGRPGSSRASRRRWLWFWLRCLPPARRTTMRRAAHRQGGGIIFRGVRSVVRRPPSRLLACWSVRQGISLLV